MSLVIDQSRSIQPVSLIRAASSADGGCGALDDANKLLARGLETYLSGLTGMRTSVHVSATETLADHGANANRAFRWSAELHPVQFSVGRVGVAQLVDCFYGGGGEPVAPDRPLSTSENRFLDRLAHAVAPLFQAAWKASASFEPTVVSAGAEAPKSTKIVFEVTCGHWSPFAVAFSYAPDTLIALTASAKSDLPGEAEAGEWEQALTALVLAVPFPVRTILAEPEVPIFQLSRLAVGDVLPIRLLPQTDLSVAGIRVARGTVGDHDGRAAFRLD